METAFRDRVCACVHSWKWTHPERRTSPTSRSRGRYVLPMSESGCDVRMDDEAAEHADTLQARAARQQHTCNREWEMVDSAHSFDDEGRVQGDLEQRRGELGCAVIVQRRSRIKAAQCIQYD